MRTHSLFAVAVACLLASSASSLAAPCPTGVSYPGATWPKAENGMDPEALRAFEDYVFTLQGEDAERKGPRTDGVVIIHKGALVYERYARGWTENKRHLTWSVSKSFTNALTGIAVARGKLAISDSICKHLVGFDASSHTCQITVKDLLEFASGLDWKEVYENESNQVSSVLAMLYGEGQPDAARFVATHAKRAEPGATWMYSSGDTTLLMAVLQSALRDEGERFPWTLLFDPIGITSATWERDAKGTMIGSSYLYATPRDMARFGYLFLRDGCWNGQRILPEDWVARSTAVSEPITRERLFFEPTDAQGWQFWLNKGIPGVTETPFPDVPVDAFFARGHWGQSIAIIPSRELIIVRVADDRDGTFDFNRYLSLAIQAVKP